MKTTHMAIALLLLVAVGCVRVSTTGGASSSRTGGLESPTVVRYHVAGFGAAKAGDYLAAPADIDKFFALGTNSVPGAGGSFDAPLATVFHRGRVFSLVSPTNVWAPFDLLVVENGRILMTVPDGACHLSFSVPDKCVEPDRKAPATVSLEQVLRLREKGKETDVPWLVGILASNLPPWHFHPFAAAQALFQIGTPEAHAALSNHLLRASFPAGPGYHYTAEWNMPEPQRSRFIQQYHLVNLARDFLVQVETEPPGKDKDRFVFVVALENFAGKPVRIREQPVYLGELLYFRDAVGRYATRKHTDTVARKLGPPRWLTLAPRQTHTYRIEARITKTDPLTLETGDMRFELGQPGAFHVCAMVEQAPTPDVTNAWVGRCVSPGTRLDLPRSPLGVVLERNGTDIAAWFVNESREVQTYKGGLGMTSARHSCALTLQSADGREWSANTEPRGDLQNYNDIVVPPGERVFIGRWDLTALRYSEGDLVRGAGQLAFQELPPGRYRVHWWDGVFQLGTPLRSVWMDVEVVGDQPSLVGHFTQKPTAQSLRTIAEDAQYKFAGHDFGNRGEDGDASVYVFHKESGQWARIDLVATRDAVFGRSPDMNKVLLSVGWDHTGLANQNYVRIPLHTSGSILLPDKIEFDADRGLYRLTHGSGYGEHSHPTVLAIRRDDLSAFFAGNRPPVTVAPALRSNFSAREFAAALRGRWESVFALPGSTNIVHAEFRADDTAVVVVAAGDAVRTYSGPYRLEFERPPSSNMVTLARITVRDQDGELVLSRVNFGLHNGVHERRLLLRIDGNPHGALDRALPWGEAVERVQEGPRTVKPAWSAVSEGLRGRLVIAQPRVPAGGRLAATLELENVGKTQWVVRTQNPFDFEARVPDAAGLDIPPTSLRSDVSYTGKFVAIPAGERLSLPVTIESQDGAKGSQVDTTTDIWTLAPGRYGLGGMYGMAVMEEKAPRGTWVGRLTLPVVPFEIVATSADLPGTEKSLIEIAGTTGNGPPWVTPVVVKCRALTDGQAQIGHSGVNHVMQDFLQVEPIVGKEELRPGTGEVFRLHYDYLAPPQFKQRPIRKGEEALWVIEQLAKMGDFSALKVLADTQENRAAVQEVFGDLTLEKRRAVLLEALGERTPMGAELEHRLRWVLRDVRHFSAKFRRGAVPADTAGAERAADGRHYVRTAITLDRLAGGPVTENWVRQLTTHIAQGNRVEELEIRVADPVASTWAAMILAMQAGDKAALAKTCTEKGYQSVVKGFRNKEAGAKDLQSWGWAWSNLPLLSRRQTAAGVMLSMGSDVKTFGFEFVETPDGWKLDRWEQAK